MPLSDAVKERMLKRAQEVKESQGFTKSWTLTGKNSICPPGGNVVIRMLPRWDGNAEDVIYVEALEHWWQDAKGQWNRAWCLKTYGEACPICEGEALLRASGVKEDKQLAYQIAAKEVFLFNAIVGPPGHRKLDEQGLVDIRPIALNGTQFLGIVAIMTGGGDENFARGNIADPTEGYELKFTRPTEGGKGQQWKVDCRPTPSPLFGAEDAASFEGWETRLTDLSAMLTEEYKDYATVYKAYYGVDPEETGGNGQATQQAKPAAAKPAVAKPAAAPAQAASPSGIDDWETPNAAPPQGPKTAPVKAGPPPARPRPRPQAG